MLLLSKAEKIFNIFEEKITEYYKTDAIRYSQVQMAMDVAAFLDKSESKRLMFMEAPVGTGKSLGSLVPALIEANKGRNCKVVYATATINLQGQLMNSEVPLLKEVKLVGQPLLAKGKANYYCHKEFKARKKQFSPKEKEVFTDFFKKAETGQRNEFEDHCMLDVNDVKWEKVALKVSKKVCEQCEYSLVCPTNGHRQSFLSPFNDLLITNHDQLIRSVLNITSEPRQSPMIPVEPGIIIIDEAHHFLENFLNQLEESFTIFKLKSLRRDISKTHKKRYEKLTHSIDEFFNIKIKSDEISLQGRYPVSDELITILKELSTIVNDSLIEKSTRDLHRHFYNKSDEGSELEDLSMVLHKILDVKFVSWINYEEKKFSLISETFPSDFRKFIKFLSITNKIIVMSGTLTSNGDFDSLIKQWRLNNNEVFTKKINSPFDYLNQAIVYVPEGIEDPNSSKYLSSISKEIKSMISLTEGRSLILTTSKEHMINVSKDLSSFLEMKQINLYVQEQSGVEKLTNQFKKDETSVLVGSGSFFSGFSVPGNSLVSVILTKLPFPVPTDPFLKLIGQGYEDEFFDMVSFPHMINKLNQAAGRLIRDINDFGVFTVLDPRIFTREYGIRIQEEFQKQGYKITRSFEEVKSFILQKFNQGSEARYEQYSRQSIVTKDVLLAIPEIKKEIKVSKEPKTRQKKNIITNKQKEFAKEICKQKKVYFPREKKTPDDLYQYLIDIYYFNWEDTAIIENGFPFSNEEEKSRLQKINGTKRKTVMPKCHELGCSGICGKQYKDEIEDKLIKEYGANTVKFYPSPCKKFCRVLVEPLEILENHFKPAKLR